MTALLSRLLGRAPTPEASSEKKSGLANPGLHVHLSSEGRVLNITGSLRHLLAPLMSTGQPLPLRGYLVPGSVVAVEGMPADWQGQSLDLSFNGPSGQVLHTRGWVQPQADGWLLQLMDTSDLLKERERFTLREQCQQLAGQIDEQLRLCGKARLPEVLVEQLQGLAQRWHIPCVALALLDDAGARWRVYSQYTCPGTPALWHSGQSLGSGLDSLCGSGPQRLSMNNGVCEYPRLQSTFANTEGFLVPYRDNQGVAAWLLLGFYPVQQQAPELSERDWLQLAAALAAPLLNRLREQRHQQQLERLDVLQTLLDAGWWEWLVSSEQLQVAPQLARDLSLKPGQDYLSMAGWLGLIHPADREQLNSCLQDLRQRDKPLSLSVRLGQLDSAAAPLWYRIQGQALGVGERRRIVGFMLNVSDMKNQEQQAAAAHARLDNLIASAPAVIYVQRYDEGALLPVFFSDSLRPLLGWTLAESVDGALVEWIHPEDRPLYFERTRQLLREGAVSRRFRLRDKAGHYHWVLDEAKLLRDDLGMPVEAIGLWLDITDATLAQEKVKQSEERYRILVEDSPAMICRYRADASLTLIFGNKPLANYLECSPEQLNGVKLGDWLSPEQRAAFDQRLARLTPECPVSSAEISLQLPGREHAWWIWSDRGVFDENGRLLEIQAVGRDNTEVRRSQQQLTQSAKMATLGEMATGLAHEINQPLNVMRMAIVNVLNRLKRGDVQADYIQEKLERIDAQVQRAARVVDHMRIFGRRSEIEEQLFNPAQAVEGTLALLGEGMKGKGVELRVSDCDLGVQVRGHVDQLEQVLINLMVNARDALLEKRSAQRDFLPWISIHADRQENHVRLWVLDNGGGIDPRLLERIFEPFFTTKPEGIGTGLGLSVSYGIVRNMGGQMSVANTEEGARFCVELPVAVAG